MNIYSTKTTWMSLLDKERRWGGKGRGGFTQNDKLIPNGRLTLHSSGSAHTQYKQLESKRYWGGLWWVTMGELQVKYRKCNSPWWQHIRQYPFYCQSKTYSFKKTKQKVWVLQCMPSNYCFPQCVLWLTVPQWTGIWCSFRVYNSHISSEELIVTWTLVNFGGF